MSATAAFAAPAGAQDPPAPANRASAKPAQSFAEQFAQVVAVLMRSRNFKQLPIGALEWLVIPPLLAGQCRVLHAKAPKGDAFAPVAMALWARVSPEVDKRLSQELDKPIQLKPNEWTSGKICWLIAVAGDAKVMPRFLGQIQQGELKGEPMKMRAPAADGKVEVRTIETKPQGG